VLDRTVWLTAFLTIGFGFELGQYMQIVPGFFDISDAALLVAAAVAAGLVGRFPCHIQRRAAG